MSHSRQQNEKRSSWWFSILALLAVGGVAYFLSVGPVLTMAARAGLSWRYGQRLRSVYAPVFAVARSSAFGTRAYQFYVGFWSRLILHEDVSTGKIDPPIETLLASIGSITNGQTSLRIFVPSRLSEGGNPISQDMALARIVEKIRQ